MAGPGQTTYSFKDTTGAFVDPDAGAFSFAGNIGMGEFSIEMSTDKTEHSVSADGSVMVSAIAGDNGVIRIQVQQTSPLNVFLLNWYNTKKTLMLQQNLITWTGATLTLRNILDGSQHVAIGISPNKLPTKTYAARGQMITWDLPAADIQTITVGTA